MTRKHEGRSKIEERNLYLIVEEVGYSFSYVLSSLILFSYSPSSLPSERSDDQASSLAMKKSYLSLQVSAMISYLIPMDLVEQCLYQGQPGLKVTKY